MELTSGLPPAGRRSVLCVPASDERKIAKALQAGADEVVLDLEDAVAPSSKNAARQVLHGFPWTDHADLPLIAVRVNGRTTSWFDDDVEAVITAAVPATSIVLPKVETLDDLDAIDDLLEGSEVSVQALIETGPGLVRLDQIVERSDRLSALIIGYADLAASLGRGAALPPESWLYCQDRVLTCARTAGVDAIDGPYLGVAVDTAFLAAAERGAALGFDAKWAIHPQQVPALNAAFQPSPAAIERAHDVLDALGNNQGAAALDGQLVDEAMALAARRVLTKAGL
ncbi:MAG: citrate lyase [Aeromicrobium sp.]|nr:citrate lyase [Aeromicrobium sp.]